MHNQIRETPRGQKVNKFESWVLYLYRWIEQVANFANLVLSNQSDLYKTFLFCKTLVVKLTFFCLPHAFRNLDVTRPMNYSLISFFKYVVSLISFICKLCLGWWGCCISKYHPSKSAPVSQVPAGRNKFFFVFVFLNCIVCCCLIEYVAWFLVSLISLSFFSLIWLWKGAT